MKLYEIAKEIYELMDSLEKYAEEHNGEVMPDFKEKISDLTLQKEDKILNVAKYIKGLESDSSGFETEIKKLQGRKKSVDNRIEWLKGYLNIYCDKDKRYEDSTTIVSWRKSKYVHIVDESVIPEKYIVTTIAKSPNKLEIRRALDSGEDVQGAIVMENQSLQIK